MVQRRTSNFSSHQLYAQFNNCACILSSKHMILSPQIASSSVQFSCSVVSDSLRPHELQHARLPCPSPTPGACIDSYTLVQFSCSVVSDSLRPHELQHAKLPCPSPTPGACIDSYTLSHRL